VRVKCPKCGMEGVLVRHTVKSKGHTYVYTAVKHVDHGRVRRCIIARGQETAPLGYDDVLEVLNSLYSLAKASALGGDREELESFLAWIERRLNPLIARIYEEASVILEQKE
jgi:hypothetical protein